MRGCSEPKSYRGNSSAAEGYNRYAAGSLRGLSPSHLSCQMRLLLVLLLLLQ